MLPAVHILNLAVTGCSSFAEVSGDSRDCAGPRPPKGGTVTSPVGGSLCSVEEVWERGTAV